MCRCDGVVVRAGLHPSHHSADGPRIHVSHGGAGGSPPSRALFSRLAAGHRHRPSCRAWNWLPPEGAAPRLDLVPWWARVWYYLPFVDRYAHAWMWRHGGWEVRSPDPELGHIGGTN
jgi:hypothetical protein